MRTKKICYLLSFMLILSLSACENKVELQETTSQEDVIDKFQKKNQKDLDQIKEFELNDEKEVNGEYIMSGSSSSSDNEYDYNTKRENDKEEDEYTHKNKTKNPDGDEDLEYSSWLYYDRDSGEWGDSFYYTAKDEYGRESYEYAYSVINGKKKVDDRLNGTRGQIVIVPDEYKVPADVQQEADDNFITIIRMPDSEFEYAIEDTDFGETFTDPYEKLEYLNDEENKQEAQTEFNQIRTEIMSEENPKVDSNMLENLDRLVDNNDKATTTQQALQKSLQIVQKYDKDYTGKGATAEENEEIEYYDNTYAYLNINNAVTWSHIGYSSELVVVTVNRINQIVKRKEAFNLIADIYEEKNKILDAATTKQEAKVANEMTITVPSAREFALQKYLTEKKEAFNTKYRETIGDLANE